MILRKTFLLAAAALLAACTGDSTGSGDVTLSLTPDSVLITVGQVVTLNAATTHTTQKPSFTTSNSAVATVDSIGRVTSRGAGVATITATVSGVRDSSKIVVTTPAATLDLTPDSVTMTVGQTRTLTANLANSNAAITFASSNTGIATIDNAGVVTAKAAGTTYVVASASALRDSTKVTVTAAPVSAPTIPLLGSGSVTERYTAEVTASGNVAYTTTWYFRNGIAGNVVKIWNVSGNTPVLTDSLVLAGAGTTSDVQISDDGALLAVSTENGGSTNGFAIYSRTNPTKPTLLIRYSSQSIRNGVHTLKFGRVSNRLYLFLNVDPGPNSPVQIVVADVTNPSQPVEVGAFPMGNPFVHDVFFRDGYLFAANWDDGMSVFDVGGAGRGGSPSNLVLLGNIRTAACPGCAGSEVHNIWWFNDPKTGSKKYAFIGEEGPASIGSWARGDVHVVDVSDFSNMKEVAFFRPDSATSSTGKNATGTHNFDMDENSGVLYAAYYNGGVRALDVRGDLSTCTAAQKSADGRCNLRLMGREIGAGLISFPTFVWGVKVAGNFLYASDMVNGIHKLDISGLKR